MSSSANRPAAFLDRDDTLIRDCHYLSSPDDIIWLPGAQQALVSLKRMGYHTLVLTNQSGVARGYLDEDTVKSIHEVMQTQLHEATGMVIDAFYYCPHHPQGVVEKYQRRCRCRKPASGLFDQAIRDWDVDPPRSIAVGDRMRDLLPAQALGVRYCFLYAKSGSVSGLEDASLERFSSWSAIVRRVKTVQGSAR